MSSPTVEVNGKYWFRVLIDHLVSLGHQRIAYIGASPDLKLQADRLKGYRDGLQLHSLAFDTDLVVDGDLTSEGGFCAGKHLLGLTKPPSAIAGVDDMTAIGVEHAARELGWTVGKDLAARPHGG